MLLLSDLMMFLFKQKTAYEMRISDWSSDVCSSDLVETDRGEARNLEDPLRRRDPGDDAARPEARRSRRSGAAPPGAGAGDHRSAPRRDRLDRSEEHTSELQSLMRISYAVFCLKKKTKCKNHLLYFTPIHQSLQHPLHVNQQKKHT